MAEVLKAIGLMSGTSMDGIDVALIETDGEDVVRPGANSTTPYSSEQRDQIAHALNEALTLSDRVQRPSAVATAERMITEAHVAAVKHFLNEQDLRVDEIGLVGFHGQTVLHRPAERLTVQIGSGQELAQACGMRVVADMRAADVAAGGQGAPLVPVYHRALASDVPASPVVFVNIGGVSNVTFVGTDGALLAFDTGPGNALIDDWVSKHSAQTVDEGGKFASVGRNQFSARALDAALSNPYFESKPPKSLDRNHDWGFDLEGMPLETGAALLTDFTAASIARGAEWFPATPEDWVICGGGRHNGELVRLLRERLGGKVSVAEDHGFDGDAIEAQAFAYLAVRSLRGLPLTYPGTTGCPEPMSGGVLFEP